jgi:ribonuclease BN (tRNA processing enzyme)
MEIRILGAHNCESKTSSCVSLLVDNTLAIEAGGLTSHLTAEEQCRIEAILVTHKHMDHIRDIPGMALNSYRGKTTFGVFSSDTVCRAISEHLLNNDIYPEFQKIPEKNPTVSFVELEPLRRQQVNGHAVMPVPVKHVAPAVGFQIYDKKDRTFFYTGDTGPGLEECWRHTAPQLLIIEVTMHNALEEFALQTGHLTPRLLEKELASFRAINGYLPPVIVIHMDAGQESDIKTELEAVKEHLQADITIAHEGMTINL